MEQSDYAKELDSIYALLQTSKTLPDRFCTFTTTIQKEIPPASITPEVLNKVKLYFEDINERIRQYDEQYQVLLQELGVICNQNQFTNTPQQFFLALLDFFKLAYSLYEDEPEKLAVFYTLLQKFHTLLETGTMSLEGELFQKALLLQLTKSAWVLSHPTKSMDTMAKQIGGSLKRKTRKQKR